MTKPHSHFELKPTGICPACRNEKSSEPVHKMTYFNVYDCAHCQMRFIDPSLTDDEQMQIYQSQETIQQVNPALQTYYDYDALNPESRTYKDYVRALSETENLVKHKSLCELGCGAGSFLRLAQSRGWTVSGIDASHENVKMLQSKGIPAIQGNIFEKEDWPQFDCVALWDVIEHPRDPGLLLSRCRNLLKPGGVLLIATPCYPNVLSQLADFLSRISGGKIAGPLDKMYMFEHITYFSPQSLKNLLHAQGFQVFKHWKTETDLKRYAFPPVTRMILKLAFGFARLLGLENRLIAIAGEK